MCVVLTWKGCTRREGQSIMSTAVAPRDPLPASHYINTACPAASHLYTPSRQHRRVPPVHICTEAKFPLLLPQHLHKDNAPAGTLGLRAHTFRRHRNTTPTYNRLSFPSSGSTKITRLQVPCASAYTFRRHRNTTPTYNKLSFPLPYTLPLPCRMMSSFQN
jgi:hypothetical protein